MKKLKHVQLLALAVGLMLFTGNVWGQYSGTGTFTKITSIGDLTDGYYVIAEANDEYAMNNVHNGTFLDRTAISPSGGSLTNPSASIVWLIETNGGGRSIYNEGIEKYVSYTGSSNNVQIVDAVTADNQRWTITYGSNVFTFTNLAVTARMLQYNASSPRFACYTSNQRKFNLYKLEEATSDPLINVNPSTLSGFTYVESNGPSSEQSFTVEGSNLTANIDVTPPSNYEISETSGSGFTSSPITLTQTGGSVAEKTIWVRLIAGLSEGAYNEDITCTSTDATPKTVSCSGTVTTPVSLPYSEDFSDCGTQEWIAVSVASNRDWTCGSGYQEINGFGGDVASDDYLISPAFDLDQSSDEIMSFTSWTRFTDVTYPRVELLYTTNYTGDPTTTTWNNSLNASATWSPENSQAWTSSGDIDISSISGTAVRFAFHYTSSGTTAGTTSQWRIDDILIQEVPVDDPASFSATVVSSSQIDLAFATNTDVDNVVIVHNADGIFSDPSGTPPAVGQAFAGGTLLYNGTTSPQSHTGLGGGETVYYKAFSYDGIHYSPGLADNATTYATEPSNHVTGFTATANSHSTITVSWTDSDANNYLIKGSDVGYGSITAPTDGVAEPDGGLVKNVAAVTKNSHQFTELEGSTTYYFKIFPYNGSGETVNYKTDGAVPQDDAKTDEAPILVSPAQGVVFISEVSDATDFNNEYIEFFNNSNDVIDLSNSKLIMQTAGTVWNISDLTGDTEIPANGLFIIARGSSKTNFESEWGALPVNCNYSEGTGGMFFGTSTTRRWVLKDGGNPGTDDGTLIDDTETTVAGSNNRTYQFPTGTWTTEGFSGNATPGYIESDEDPAAYLWDGGASTSFWGDAANWNPDQVPGPNTNVTIPYSKQEIVIQSTEEADCYNLTVNGTLTIKSDATGTGSLIIHGNVSGTGTMAMERFIPAHGAKSATGWHFLSSPVNNFAIGSSDFAPGTNDDFYAWDEGTNTWLNYKVGSNNITNFIDGQGYLVAYADDLAGVFTGTFNVGDVEVDLNLTQTKDDFNGWNLLGNPYPSAIDWSVVGNHTETFEDVFAYVWDRNKDGGAGYTYIDGREPNAFIPANQGFFVKTKAAGSFTFNNDMRAHGGAFLKSSPADDRIVLRFAGDHYFDQTTLRLRKGSQFSRDPLDALKMFSFDTDVPQIFTVTTDQRGVAINSIPTVDESLVIPVGLVVPANGSMTITLKELSGDFENLTVLLHDQKTDLLHRFANLQDGYSFDATTDDTDRFLLKFETVSVHELPAEAALHIYAHGSTVYLNSRENLDARVSVYNITGQQVHGQRMAVDGLSAINLNLPTGWYVVTVTTDKEMTTQKVFIR